MRPPTLRTEVAMATEAIGIRSISAEVNPELARAGRLWRVIGVSPETTITGLTKREAELVVLALEALEDADGGGE